MIIFILGITACEYIPPIDQSISKKEFILAEKAYEDQVNKAEDFGNLKDSLCSIAEETYDLYLTTGISDEEINAYISLVRKIDDLLYKEDAYNINKIINLYNSRKMLKEGMECFDNKEYISAFNCFSNIINEDKYSEEKVLEIIKAANIQEVKDELITDIEDSIEEGERPSYMKGKYVFVEKIIGNDEYQKYEERITDSIERKIENEPKQKELSNYEKKKICEYIQSRYDYYDKKEGRNTGDKYTDVIWEEVSNMYGLTELEIDIIWSHYYTY